jgi:hypothetical protein
MKYTNNVISIASKAGSSLAFSRFAASLLLRMLLAFAI